MGCDRRRISRGLPGGVLEDSGSARRSGLRIGDRRGLVGHNFLHRNEGLFVMALVGLGHGMLHVVGVVVDVRDSSGHARACGCSCEKWWVIGRSCATCGTWVWAKARVLITLWLSFLPFLADDGIVAKSRGRYTKTTREAGLGLCVVFWGVGGRVQRWSLCCPIDLLR